MLPTIHFIYNTSLNDAPYTGTGESVDNWISIPSTELMNFTMVHTGGGILGTLTVPVVASGTRDATIKPTLEPQIIPQLFIEDSELMTNVPMAGFGGVNYAPYRYVLGLYVDGETTSSIYLEAWDDFSFSTTSLEVLQGTVNSGGNSLINAIRTTESAPEWNPGWGGYSGKGSFLRGVESRLALKNSSSISNEAVFFNIYIQLETDCTVFHNRPCLSFRYLYS
jgi:hypothetical protein